MAAPVALVPRVGLAAARVAVWAAVVMAVVATVAAAVAAMEEEAKEAATAAAAMAAVRAMSEHHHGLSAAANVWRPYGHSMVR